MTTKYFPSEPSAGGLFGWTLQQVLLLNTDTRSLNGDVEERDDCDDKYCAPGQATNASFGWTIQQLLLHKYSVRRASCANVEELTTYGTDLRVTDISPSLLSIDTSKTVAITPENAKRIKCPSPITRTMEPLISAHNPGSTKRISCSPSSSVTNKLDITTSIPCCPECVGSSPSSNVTNKLHISAPGFIRCPQSSSDSSDHPNSATNADCTKCVRYLSLSKVNTRPQSYAPRPHCNHGITNNCLGNRSLDDKSSSLNLDERTECDSLISDEGYETVDRELDSGHFDTSLPVLCPRLMNLLGPISPDGRVYLEAMIGSSTEFSRVRSGRRRRRKAQCDRLRYIHSIETDSPLQNELDEPRSLFFGTVNRLTLQLRNITNDATSMHIDLQMLKQDYQELDVEIGDVLEEAKQLKSELEALSYLNDLIWLLRGRLDLISPRRWPFLIAQESFSTNLVI